jgi:hypothetical protein
VMIRLSWPPRSTFRHQYRGHLVTGMSGKEVRWAEFERAVEAGLIDGDPRCLIVFSGAGAADGLVDIAQWAFNNRDAIVAELANLGILAGAVEASRRACLCSRVHERRGRGWCVATQVIGSLNHHSDGAGSAGRGWSGQSSWPC